MRKSIFKKVRNSLGQLTFLEILKNRILRKMNKVIVV